MVLAGVAEPTLDSTGMCREDFCSSLGGFPYTQSSQTTAECPTSLLFFFCPKPRVVALWRVAAVGTEGGKMAAPLPFGISLVT